MALSPAADVPRRLNVQALPCSNRPTSPCAPGAWVLMPGSAPVKSSQMISAIALLAVVVHLADGAGERLLHAGTCHQRIKRGLAGPRLDDTLDVADENVLGLRGEVEYHVGVHGCEIRARVLDTLEDLLSATVLIVAIHLLEQTVVEASARRRTNAARDPAACRGSSG